MKCRPRKWLWGLIPLLVPFAAAWWLGTDSLERRLQTQVEAKLRLAGLEWATVKMDGRDAVLRGEVETEEAKRKALDTVAGQYGIRRVASAVAVIPPVVLNVPTVNSVATNNPALPITGTWQEGVAKALTVSIAGQKYVLGNDPELSSSNGTWSLKPRTPLPDGVYDVKVEISDGNRARAADATASEVLLDTTPPQAPSAAATTNPPLSGKWDEEQAKSLKVTVAGKTYVLGIDGSLSSDGKGNWKLVLTDSFAPGGYDVAVETSDEFGNVSKDGTVGELAIAPDLTPPASPTITPFAGDRSPAELAGTWPEGDAVFLAITVHGRSYIFGSDPTLKSDGKGNWRLALADELPRGVHDVAITISDASGNRSADLTRGEIQVKGAPPAKPVPAPPEPAAAQATAPQAAAPKAQAAAPEVTAPKAAAPQTTAPAATAPQAAQSAAPQETAPQAAAPQATAPHAAAPQAAAPATAPQAEQAAAPQVTAPQAAAPQVTAPPQGDAPQAAAPEVTAPPAAQAAAPQPTAPQAARHKRRTTGAAPEVTAPQAAQAAAPQAAAAPQVTAPQAAPSQASAPPATAAETATPAVAANNAATLVPAAPAPPAQETKVASLAEPVFEPETDVSVNRSCQEAINAAMAGRFIFFLSDGDTIAPESLELLKKVAKAAEKCPRSRIEVGGHTDATGSPTHNLELSERRAGSVLEALVTSGLTRARLSAVGYGEQKPAATNKTPEGRAINRRIEFVVAQ